MTLDEAIEYAEKFMGDYAKLLLASTLYAERGKPTDQHAFDVAEQREAQMARDLGEALVMAGTDYRIQFAPTLDRPPETMVGETVFDAEGNAIGWIANAPAEPDEATMLKLHGRMNAVLLDMNDELLAYHPRDRENASSKELIDCVIRAHQIIEDAAMVGVGTCHMRLVYEEEDADGCIWPDHYECDACGAKVNGIMPFCDMEIPPKFCPNCGKRIIEEETE